MNTPLIVGVDGSAAGLRALDWAVTEAIRHELSLRLVHGSLWERYESVRPDVRTESTSDELVAEHIVASAAERVARMAPELEVTTALAPSAPGMALLREGERAFAIVVGTRGRGAVSGMLLGSTSLEVAAYATCPVIVVRGEPANIAGATGRVTLGVGPLNESAAAIEFAFSEAQVREADLLAVHAWHRPAHELSGTAHLPDHGTHPLEREAERDLAEELLATAQAYPKVAVQSLLPEGRAHDALLEATTNSDLLVVGARRPRGSIGMQLGLVNHAVLHHAACPVVVVPQRS